MFSQIRLLGLCLRQMPKELSRCMNTILQVENTTKSEQFNDAADDYEPKHLENKSAVSFKRFYCCICSPCW